MKEILKTAHHSGPVAAMELLYDHYGGMLFSYILQFVPDKIMAGKQLVEIFSRLAPRLSAAFDSPLSIYCWLQIEARKIILEGDDHRAGGDHGAAVDRRKGGDGQPGIGGYFALLVEAPPEHQWVFRELFVHGRCKEELAVQSGKSLDHINNTLRECLIIIRRNLG
jgi:hypothetical protein